MTPKQLSVALQTLIPIQQPVFVWGAPGIGKSQIVAQTASTLGLELRDVRAVLLDPVDLRGLPHINNDGHSHWAAPAFLPRTGAGVLFLDELNAAPPLVQAACYQLVLDRQLGEYRLPDGWSIVAAGNRESDGAVVHRMPSALRNRFVHLDAETSLDDWSSWAIGAGIEPAVIAFVRYRPELLHSFSRNDRAFPTPRSWEFVSRIAAAHSVNPEIEHALFCGAVGEGAGVEFSAFLRLYRDLPSIDAILLNPTQADVSDSPATLYAVASALARRAALPNWGRVLCYSNRMPAEYGVLVVKDAITRTPALQSTPEFTRWAIAHQDVVF